MKLTAFAVLTSLFVSACSTTALPERTLVSTAPASCLSKCSSLPRATSFESFALAVVPLYADCAVLHEQCSAAILEHFNKE